MRSAASTLEQLVAEGEVVGGLLWDRFHSLTWREQQLVRQAFAKGIEIGQKLARAKEPRMSESAASIEQPEFSKFQPHDAARCRRKEDAHGVHTENPVSG